MLEAPLPENEALRIAALRSLRLLDTPPEQRFNRITRTAARLLRMPVATVTLLDSDRQWFKSRYGLFIAQTPRTVAFCSHAILEAGVFVVEDALADDRFRDNPLVSGPPHIRFYAGRPLSSPGGLRLGTLCIMDREPRTLSGEDRLALEDMANWAEMEINVGAELTRSREHLVLALEQAQEGVILMDAEGQVSWANPALTRWLGHAATPSPEGLQHILATETLDAMDRELTAARLESGPARMELDAGVMHRDGRMIVTQAVANATLVDGERLVSLVIDRARMRERG